jgi:formylglycine-generating enzyme required for sulfatase activity
MRRFAPWVLATSLASCGGAAGRDQWIVTIRTDAPVPQMGDRLLVEVLSASGEPACSACRREFGFTDGGGFPLSYGIAAVQDGLRIRARLYRSTLVGSDGRPARGMLLDHTVRLPSARGPTPVNIELRMTCLGVTADVAGHRTCDPSNGELGPEPIAATGSGDPAVSPGAWPPSRRVECASAAPGMVCVPGGVFLLGSSGNAYGDSDAKPERLVRLSPFLLDVDEVTVGTIRALSRRVALSPTPRSSDPADLGWACTWLGPDDPANDAMPINCVTRSDAQKACEALGGRLPTEAEWEWAAGNLEEETPFPWGDDLDICGHAVVSRSRIEYELRDPTVYDEFTDCRVTPEGTLPFGPVAGGHPGDITRLGIRNLGGSLSEWVADRFAPYDDDCWEPAMRLLESPRCDRPSKAQGLVVRGGAWASPAPFARAHFRQPILRDGKIVTVGFRCARDAAPLP